MNPINTIEFQKRVGLAKAASRGITPTPVMSRHGYPIDASMLTHLLPVPPESRWERWQTNPEHPHTPKGCAECWFSRVYIVQVAQGPTEPWKRLSIRRINGKEIHEGWNELWSIKNDIAGADALAVEVYPSTADLVDLAPMRHLFVVPPGFDLPCVWKAGAAR